MTISEKIFNRLSELNMSQKEFSAKTGISTSTISDWKTKGYSPNVDKIMDICYVLEMTPTDLLSQDRQHAVDGIYIDGESEEAHLIEVYENLDKRQRDYLIGYAQGLLNQNRKK